VIDLLQRLQEQRAERGCEDQFVSFVLGGHNLRIPVCATS
jgi:hypothetical protein